MSQTTRKRLSMNTILKNARIFDEELADDTLGDTKSEIKFDGVKNVKIEFEESNFKMEFGGATNVKIEVDNDESSNMTLRKRKQVTYDDTIKVKEEPIIMDEDTVFPSNVFDKLNLRNEEQYLTPVKLEVEENTASSVDSNSRKSAKRTVFPRESPYKTRQSPYKRNITDNSQTTAFYHKDGTSDKTKERTQRKSVELESDPVVLQRRQKQIDYGKNTIGYDVYINTVPRNKRKIGDPQTPNKYVKYSRRGFDGLIKQWRLKLHKYDPPQDE